MPPSVVELSNVDLSRGNNSEKALARISTATYVRADNAPPSKFNRLWTSLGAQESAGLQFRPARRADTTDASDDET
jgi:hypothetical protein